MVRRRFLSLVLAATLAAAPDTVRAAKRSFMPRFVDLVATLRLENRFREQKRKTDVNGKVRRQRTDLEQTLEAMGLWYVYHPRFHYFTVTAEVGLEQDFLQGEGQSSNGITNLLYEGFFLPEHPYNLTLRLEQEDHRFPGGGSLEDGDRTREAEAEFRYARRPWNATLTLSYDDRYGAFLGAAQDGLNRESRGEDFKARNHEWKLAVRHWSPRFSSSFRYKVQEGRRFQMDGAGNHVGADLARQQGSLVNRVSGDRFLFESTWEYSQYKYRDDLNRTTSFDNDLELYLPHGFEASFSLENEFGRQRYGTYADNLPVNTTRLSEERYDLDVELRHQLYESLRSRLMFSLDHWLSSTIQSQGGTGEASRGRRRWLYEADYKKKLPRQGRLTASLQVERTKSSRLARQEGVVLEDLVKGVEPNQPFKSSRQEVDLNDLDADPDKFQLEVCRDAAMANGCQDQTDFILLRRGIDYTVTPGDSNEAVVEVLAMPPGAAPDANGKYVVLLRYQLLSGDYQLDTHRTDYRIGLQLFDDLLALYLDRERSSHRRALGSTLLADVSPIEKQLESGATLNLRPFQVGVRQSRLVYSRDRQVSREGFVSVDYRREMGRFLLNPYGRAGRQEVTQRQIAGVDVGGYALRKNVAGLRFSYTHDLGRLTLESEGRWTRGATYRTSRFHRFNAATVVPRLDVQVDYTWLFSLEERAGLTSLEVRTDTFSGTSTVRGAEEIENNYAEERLEHRVTLGRLWPESGFRLRCRTSYITEEHDDHSQRPDGEKDWWSRRLEVDLQGGWAIGLTSILLGVEYDYRAVDSTPKAGDPDRTTNFEAYLNLQRRLR